jgi:hypothetical protein
MNESSEPAVPSWEHFYDEADMGVRRQGEFLDPLAC